MCRSDLPEFNGFGTPPQPLSPSYFQPIDRHRNRNRKRKADSSTEGEEAQVHTFVPLALKQLGKFHGGMAQVVAKEAAAALRTLEAMTDKGASDLLELIRRECGGNRAKDIFLARDRSYISTSKVELVLNMGGYYVSIAGGRYSGMCVVIKYYGQQLAEWRDHRDIYPGEPSFGEMDEHGTPAWAWPSKAMQEAAQAVMDAENTVMALKEKREATFKAEAQRLAGFDVDKFMRKYDYDLNVEAALFAIKKCLEGEKKAEEAKMEADDEHGDEQNVKVIQLPVGSRAHDVISVAGLKRLPIADSPDPVD